MYSTINSGIKHLHNLIYLCKNVPMCILMMIISDDFVGNIHHSRWLYFFQSLCQLSNLLFQIGKFIAMKNVNEELSHSIYDFVS